MTLDELIAAACELRANFGGKTTVVVLTPRGYAHPALVEGLGFESRDGEAQPVVIVGPGEPSAALPSSHRAS